MVETDEEPRSVTFATKNSSTDGFNRSDVSATIKEEKVEEEKSTTPGEAEEVACKKR